ncbi:MAG: MiaB/RimO family radical SAM methylthiotransferase [Lachnospiraceae bacterium]|nr:MiaB/RimO family radical SAM methylthiotransferase [Lachnospiraceae bacterium]
MKSVAFHNLGCKVNSYEMEVMQQNFQKSGYAIVDFAQKADIYVINTCTVTNIADRKSRQMIHRARQLSPDALIIAVGCYVQTHAQEILEDDSIDLAIGNNKKQDIVAIVEEFLSARTADDAQSSSKKTLGGSTIPDLRRGSDYEEMQLEQTAEHTRVYIKIQDGCNQFCSYCAIPLARGRVRSRKKEAILAEAQRMAEKGYREIVLTGIHISSYGLDFSGLSYNTVYSEKIKNSAGTVYSDNSVYSDKANDASGNMDFGNSTLLLELIEALSQIGGIDRIRLSSLEPRIITDAFAKRLSRIRKVCPHFHLSLQSGCDSVLKRMNRRYTCDDFRESVGYLRTYFDRPAITTDLIAGFPGETEDEFEETLRFVDQIGFYETHIFPYSRRKGTAADRMDGQLTEREKKERCARLEELNREKSASYRASFFGKTLPVLFERSREIDGVTYVTGHTTNYIEVAVPMQELAKAARDFANSSAAEGKTQESGSLLTEKGLIVDCRLIKDMGDGLICGKMAE